MNEKVSVYLEKQKSPQKEVCIKLRKLILGVAPNIREEMKWGVPSYDGGKFYFVALKDSVNMGFSIKGLSKEETALLEGTGKTMKCLKIESLTKINEKQILRLIKLVNKG